MFLIDTSVWIDYLRGSDQPAVSRLEELLDNPLAAGLCDQIYLEILQGARDIDAFERLQRYFSGQRFYLFNDSRRSHERAARMYFDGRQQGLTVRSSVDCLIAQCAIEHDLILLHHDRDFVKLSSLVPELQHEHYL